MKRILLVVLPLFVAACALTPGYYWQAARGQFDLMARAQETPPDTQPAPLRDRLKLAADIRDFASRELGLPDNASYRRYADLQRPFALWNVFATPQLSMVPEEWCLPVAGCVSYLGFFDEAAAHAKAAELKAAGRDVHIGGVPAYSTLGWFDDPLLSTFINWPEPELARLIFHELAHQVMYVQDDSEFNESFAAAVEEAGVRRWLSQPGKEALRAQFERTQVARVDFATLIIKYRDRLRAVYRSQQSDAEKLAAKQAVIAEMRAEHAALKAGRWNGFAGYDRWFEQDINNATLASVGLYKALVPSFLAMLEAEGGNLPQFYLAARELAQLPEQERRVRLSSFSQRAPALSGNTLPQR